LADGAAMSGASAPRIVLVQTQAENAGDGETFEQTIGAPIGSSPLWPGGRLHTLNRAGSLEVIDGVAINPKLAPLRAVVASRPEPRASVEEVQTAASP
jgi:hypothetical protein